MAVTKARLLSKGATRCKFSLPVEVIADNIIRKVKKDKYPLLLSMTVGELGVEVRAYLDKELNSQPEGKKSVQTRVYKDVYDLIHEQLETSKE